MSIPKPIRIGIYRKAIVYPATVSLCKIPELVAPELEIAESGGNHTEGSCSRLLRRSAFQASPVMLVSFKIERVQGGLCDALLIVKSF